MFYGELFFLLFEGFYSLCHGLDLGQLQISPKMRLSLVSG